MDIEGIAVKAAGVLLGLLSVFALAAALATGWGVAHQAMRILSGEPYDDGAEDRPWRKESCTAAVIQTIALVFFWMALVVLNGGRQLGFNAELSEGLGFTWLAAGGVLSVWAITYVWRSWQGKAPDGPSDFSTHLDRPGWLVLEFFVSITLGLLMGLTGPRLFLE